MQALTLDVNEISFRTHTRSGCCQLGKSVHIILSQIRTGSSIQNFTAKNIYQLLITNSYTDCTCWTGLCSFLFHIQKFGHLYLTDETSAPKDNEKRRAKELQFTIWPVIRNRITILRNQMKQHSTSIQHNLKQTKIFNVQKTSRHHYSTWCGFKTAHCLLNMNLVLLTCSLYYCVWLTNGQQLFICSMTQATNWTFIKNKHLVSLSASGIRQCNHNTPLIIQIIDI